MEAYELADWQKELDKLAQDARHKGYTVTTPQLFTDDIYGKKLAYYAHGGNKIVFHEHYMQHADSAEVYNTLIHELAHAIAEQNNTGAKGVWHGDEWKRINAELGGDAARYHQGGYTKPAFKKLSKAELYSIQPKHPADTWERGTFNQWLRRGYHVMKGQKGQLSVWEFSADEYETSTDGKTSTWGKASAVYFTAEQVEPNQVKEEGK